MRYTLKDAGLQYYLDKLSDGDFSERLAQKTSTTWPMLVRFGKPVGQYESKFVAVLTPEEVAHWKEYDPTTWNGEEAMPPVGIPLRVEVRRASDGHKNVERYCAIFDGERWVHSNGRDGIMLLRGDDVRFTAWE